MNTTNAAVFLVALFATSFILTSANPQNCGTVKVAKSCDSSCPKGTTPCGTGQCCQDVLESKTVAVAADANVSHYCEAGMEECGNHCCTSEVISSTKKSPASSSVFTSCPHGTTECGGSCCEDVVTQNTITVPKETTTSYSCPQGWYECPAAEAEHSHLAHLGHGGKFGGHGHLGGKLGGGDGLKKLGGHLGGHLDHLHHGKGGKKHGGPKCCKDVSEEVKTAAVANVSGFCSEGVECGKGHCCVEEQTEKVKKQKMQKNRHYICPSGTQECRHGKGCCSYITETKNKKIKAMKKKVKACPAGTCECGHFCCADNAYTVTKKVAPKTISSSSCPANSYACGHDKCCAQQTKQTVKIVAAETYTTTECPAGTTESHKGGCEKTVSKPMAHKSKSCPHGSSSCKAGCCQTSKVSPITQTHSNAPAGAFPCGGKHAAKHPLFAKHGGGGHLAHLKHGGDDEDQWCVTEEITEEVQVPAIVDVTQICEVGVQCGKKCCVKETKVKQQKTKPDVFTQSYCNKGTECGKDKCCYQEVVTKTLKAKKEAVDNWFCAEGTECGHKQCCTTTLGTKTRKIPMETSVSYSCPTGTPCGNNMCCDHRPRVQQCDAEVLAASYCPSGTEECKGGCCQHDLRVSVKKSAPESHVSFSCGPNTYECGHNECCEDLSHVVQKKHKKRVDVSHTCPSGTYACIHDQRDQCCKEVTVTRKEATPAVRSCYCPAGSFEGKHGCEQQKECQKEKAHYHAVGKKSNLKKSNLKKSNLKKHVGNGHLHH